MGIGWVGSGWVSLSCLPSLALTRDLLVVGFGQVLSGGKSLDLVCSARQSSELGSGDADVIER